MLSIFHLKVIQSNNDPEKIWLNNFSANTLFDCSQIKSKESNTINKEVSAKLQKRMHLQHCQ